MSHRKGCTTFLLPISSTDWAAIRRLIHSGQLKPTSEQVVGTAGQVYVPAKDLLPTIHGATDHALNIGNETLQTAVYRLPEAEYTAFVRASAGFHGHGVGYLMPALLHPRDISEELPWVDNLVEEVAVGLLLTGPQPQLVGERWSVGAFAPELTRVVVQPGHRPMLQLGFCMPLSPQDIPAGAMAIDIGLQPLAAVAMTGGGSWSVGNIYPLSRAASEYLVEACQKACLDVDLVLATLAVMYYRASAQLLEEGVFLAMEDGVTRVVIEELNHNSFRSGFIQRRRANAVIDCHSAWIPQRANAYGAKVVRVHPAYTSQICSQCPEEVRGVRHGDMFRCPICGVVMNAHENAAKNILRRGLRLS